jgi:hypothetical protein
LDAELLRRLLRHERDSLGDLCGDADAGIAPGRCTRGPETRLEEAEARWRADQTAA